MPEAWCCPPQLSHAEPRMLSHPHIPAEAATVAASELLTATLSLQHKEQREFFFKVACVFKVSLMSLNSSDALGSS